MAIHAWVSSEELQAMKIMSIPTQKHNKLSKGKLDYSTRNVRRFGEGNN